MGSSLLPTLRRGSGGRLAPQRREHRELPGPQREYGAAAGPFAGGQRRVSPRQLVEFTRQAVDRLLELGEARARQEPGDEPQVLAGTRERGVEELALHFLYEKALHGPVLAPREVPGGQELHAIE